MFWSKNKSNVEPEKRSITLSKRFAFANPMSQKLTTFVAYFDEGKWRGLVGYEQFREEIDQINKVQKMILDHLELIYVPAKKTCEPEKLVEKDITMENVFLSAGSYSPEDFFKELTDAHQSINKKRGRPKKKK